MMERESRLRETFYLRMKQSGKELDPKHFDKKAQAAFQASDQKEWASWLKNKTVRLLSHREAARIPKTTIFKIPFIPFAAN